MKHPRPAAVLALAATAALLGLFGADPGAARGSRRALRADRPSDDAAGDRLCVATIDDGRVAAASIVDPATGAYVNLALPPGYEARASVECTLTDADGRVAAVQEGTRDRPLRFRRRRHLLGGRREASEGGGGKRRNPCDPRSFQPGYYDKRSGAWVDGCTRKETALEGMADMDDIK